MKMFRYAVLTAATICFLQPVLTAQETILGLDGNNGIVSVLSNAPVAGAPVTGAPVPVTGLLAGDTLEAIDFRPGNGLIYAVGSGNNIYTLNRATFAATLLGNFNDGVNDDPAGAGPLSGNSFAFDFNPAFTPDASLNPRGSFARIISDTDFNRVINGNTGEDLGPRRTDVFFPAGDANANADPNIQGIAYDNNIFGSTSTVQFGIDTEQDVLVTVANNAGTLGTVGGLGSDFSGEVGFDISGATGTGFVSFENATLAGSQLYTIDLTSGTPTLIGDFGAGNTIKSLTVVGAVPEPSTAGLLALGMIGLAGRRRRK